jgi:hypothetical protein
VDLVAVDALLGYYLRRTVLERLRQEVVAPARGASYEVWLGGAASPGNRNRRRVGPDCRPATVRAVRATVAGTIAFGAHGRPGATGVSGKTGQASDLTLVIIDAR